MTAHNPDHAHNVIVRYPPSPTGLLHVGNARTALFNYLFAKHYGGTLIVRMEDTDKVRSQAAYESDILEGLSWLNIQWDGNVARQSERTEIYTAYLKRLIDEGHAYISHETEGENREVVRFKNPQKTITFTDLIRGDISVDTTDLGDFIIARNINEPVYHLAVVVDDFESGITHVIRGDDGIANTPRQILIQEALGAPRPLYAHVPLVLAEDRTKLSKRKHGEAVSLKHYRDAGYTPEALVNFLALIGWNPGTEQEIFTMNELIAQFDITKVQKSGGVFNVEKLRFINKEHLKTQPESVLQKNIAQIFADAHMDIPDSRLSRAFATIFERINVWSDLRQDIASGAYAYLLRQHAPSPETIPWKKSDAKKAKMYLAHTIELLQSIDTIASVESIKELLWPYAEQEGRGDVLWPIRMSLSYLEKSPDPFTLLYILGKDESIARLEIAKNTL